MPIWPGIAGCSSMFILASLTLPLADFTAFSRIGVSCLQGPHQGAQKSTSTGCFLDASMTSLTKPCVVVSLTTLSAAVIVAPPFCSMFPRLFFRFHVGLNGHLARDCNRVRSRPRGDRIPARYGGHAQSNARISAGHRA